MKIDLIELLSKEDICHPSRISNLQINGDNSLSLSVSGFPWWLGELRTKEEGEITFHFEGIRDGSIEANLILHDMFDEDLEIFDATKLSDCDWAKGTECEIFCFHDFLVSANCPYSVSHYLNFGHSDKLEDFLSIAKKDSFLLFRGPEYAGKMILKALEIYKDQYRLLSCHTDFQYIPEPIF